jgi:hypothetical protein
MWWRFITLLAFMHVLKPGTSSRTSPVKHAKHAPNFHWLIEMMPAPYGER